MSEERKLQFRGGIGMSLIPVAIEDVKIFVSMGVELF